MGSPFEKHLETYNAQRALSARFSSGISEIAPGTNCCLLAGEDKITLASGVSNRGKDIAKTFTISYDRIYEFNEKRNSVSYLFPSGAPEVEYFLVYKTKDGQMNTLSFYGDSMYIGMNKSFSNRFGNFIEYVRAHIPKRETNTEL